MAEAEIDILGDTYEVEYDFEITSSGSSGSPPTLEYPGDAPEPAEFDITVHSIRESGQSVALELPPWLKSLIEGYLARRDDINEKVQDADQDRDDGDDFDE